MKKFALLFCSCMTLSLAAMEDNNLLLIRDTFNLADQLQHYASIKEFRAKLLRVENTPVDKQAITLHDIFEQIKAYLGRNSHMPDNPKNTLLTMSKDIQLVLKEKFGKEVANIVL